MNETEDMNYECINQECPFTENSGLQSDDLFPTKEETAKYGLDPEICATCQPLPRIVNGAGEAEQKAIDWQNWASEQSLSYAELAEWTGYFETLGKKYDLIDEFKENGII